MQFHFRDAKPQDRDELMQLLPRLADFDLPESRDPRHLWSDDAALLDKHFAGEAGDCFTRVATDEAGALVGMILVRMRPELLSHRPSAHLEAIVVAKRVEGRGVARRLLVDAEAGARDRGAQSLTLHVFQRNTRARQLYERAGYDGELVRFTKAL